MSRQVNIAEAKAKLSELVDAASRGEEIVLARHGKPMARLTRIASAQRGPRKFGQDEHAARHIDWDKWWNDWKAMDKEIEDAYEKADLTPRGFAEGAKSISGRAPPRGSRAKSRAKR